MHSEQENNWILSAVEVNLCVNILGRQEWNGFPVQETEQPLQQRILEGFFKLAERGLLESTPTGYRAAAAMRQRMDCIAWPEYIWGAYYPQLPPLFLYKKGTQQMGVQQITTEQQSCRIFSVEQAPIEVLLSPELRDMVAVTESTVEEAPEETFVMESELGEILAASKAVFVKVDQTTGTLSHMARILEDKECLWLSALGEQRISVFSLTEFERWLEKA